VYVDCCDKLFVFLKRRDAEPTNNESERALRPSVIFRNYAARTIMRSWRREVAARRGFLIDLTPHNGSCARPCSAWP
jgi:hypothetical protein